MCTCAVPLFKISSGSGNKYDPRMLHSCHFQLVFSRVRYNSSHPGECDERGSNAVHRTRVEIVNIHNMIK
jgi:hypothetical protein